MMQERINVRALKGAPLSIVIVLMLQRRSVSHSLLCQETGYSDRTVTQALDYLTSNQIVTRTGHSGFQLTGDNYQLPLYWDEKIEPADPSPALTAPEVSLPKADPQKFCGQNSCPEIVKITTLEKRIEDLQNQISELNRNFYEVKSQINPENKPEIVKNTDEIVKSTPLINELRNTDTDNNRSSLIDSDKQAVIAEYARSISGYGRGIEYTPDQLQELAAIAVSADMLEFVLPRAKSFESAKMWVQLHPVKAKFHYLKRIGVKDPALSNIINNPDISLFLIDHHYWHWFLRERGENPNLQLGWAVRKILDQYDREAAESSGPLQVAFL